MFKRYTFQLWTVVCGTGWQLLNGDCFKVMVNSAMRNVYDARQVCSTVQADLASIANYALETSLYNYFLTLVSFLNIGHTIRAPYILYI